MFKINTAHMLINAVIALLISLTPARANANVPERWEQKALALSEQVWKTEPLRIEYADPTVVGGDVRWGGWAYAGEPVIYIPKDRYWLGYPEFCHVILHETGHIAGVGHRDRGIMRPEMFVGRSEGVENGKQVVKWGGVDRRCL